MKAKLITALLATALVLSPLALKALGSQRPMPVELEAPTRRELQVSVLASGNLEYRTQAVLSPEVLARVSRILVKEGDTVRAGEVVMLLDDKGLTAEREQYAAALGRERIQEERSAKKLQLQASVLARNEKLHATRLIEDIRLDQLHDDVISATAEVAAARQARSQASAALDQALDRLSKTVITSPINGTVTTLRIKVGETAVPSSTGIAGSNLMTVADAASLMARIYVDEADVGRLQLGQKVSIFPASAEDEPVPGHVIAIALSPRDVGAAGSARQSNTSYPVEVALQAGANTTALRPGMTCRAEIHIRSVTKVLSIPQQAVFVDDDTATAGGKAAGAGQQHYVWVANDGVVERRIVEIGESDDAYQQIKAGLSGKDRVVVGPYRSTRLLVAGTAITASKASR